MIIEFRVPGEPKGKARARTVRGKNGMVHSFTPDTTVNYENWVKECFLQKYPGFVPVQDGYITCRITAEFPIPKTASKVRKQFMIHGDIRPTKKPDVDNIFKIVTDALNGIAYHDDSMIVDCSVEKFYSNEPGVNVFMILKED